MSMQELQERINMYNSALNSYHIKDSDVFRLAQNDDKYIPLLSLRNSIIMNLPSVC